MLAIYHTFAAYLYFFRLYYKRSYLTFTFITLWVIIECNSMKIRQDILAIDFILAVYWLYFFSAYSFSLLFFLWRKADDLWPWRTQSNIHKGGHNFQQDRNLRKKTITDLCGLRVTCLWYEAATTRISFLFLSKVIV